MDGPSSSSTARRTRARVTRAAVIAVLALTGFLATAGTASAAGRVTPILDCYVKNSDGSWTAVFGYDNTTGVEVTIPIGPDNKVTPPAYGTPQPTVFEPGVNHGAFTVTVTRGAGPMWHLDRTNLAARVRPSKACPSPTELPEEGNGTGAAIALAVAGVIGGVLVHRARKRALAVTGRGDA